MPFSYSLIKLQQTKLWTFKITDEARELQALLDNGDRQGYVRKLAELSNTGKHQFSRTKGVVYEIFDEGETITLPIKFQVKNAVITWSFIAPMDKTHQDFRDQVFNTAAKAHASVHNSCETYYRGTNHYHLKAMHSYAEESEFNHNHYRTADDGPITPVEVYEHLYAFYAQPEGKQFISSPEERDDIILKYAIYWADYSFDINYVIFSLAKTEGGLERLISQLEDIAEEGSLTPDEADKKLDAFFKSEHAQTMFAMVRQYGFPGEYDLESYKKYIKESYRNIYNYKHPMDYASADMELDHSDLMDIEPFSLSSGSSRSSPVSSSGSSPGQSSSSKSRSGKSSPKDEYLTDSSQQLDDIDIAEFEAFAHDLTKHCQSIDKKILEDLTLEDFRKGLLLYYALRSAQIVSERKPKEGERFHSDLITDAQIKEMIKELPSLQQGSTEDSIGGPLINKLVNWVSKASPKLEEWINWVSINGSRGLGSEIAQVRQASGAVDLRQAVPQGDRSKDSKIAEINFDKVNLQALFRPHVFNKEHKSNLINHPQAEKLRAKLTDEISRLTNEMISGQPKSDPLIYKEKIEVIEAALSLLHGKGNLADLVQAIEKNAHWNIASPGMKSKLEKYVNETFSLIGPVSDKDPSNQSYREKK